MRVKVKKRDRMDIGWQKIFLSKPNVAGEKKKGCHPSEVGSSLPRCGIQQVSSSRRLTCPD